MDKNQGKNSNNPLQSANNKKVQDGVSSPRMVKVKQQPSKPTSNPSDSGSKK
ncbi:hypothetical protein [Helicobacter sp. 10-6591]|uniref:hypothetical protein n=1 Tax=Helicobacter sp. 10-6591 TaxID=2004998 RepID=UPI0015EC670A|nr:hypothetical protein [Helicobacter sp. 10-6591]